MTNLIIFVLTGIIVYFVGGFIWLTFFRWFVKTGRAKGLFDSDSEDEFSTTLMWPIALSYVFFDYFCPIIFRVLFKGTVNKINKLSWKIVDWITNPRKKIKPTKKKEKQEEENITYRDTLCSECKQKKKTIL